MKEYVLNYYPKFKCVAGQCKHTCCAGWEMCIDKDTLSHYKNLESDYAKTLHKGINFKRAKFRADKNGRCAFLNDKGLCEIILNLGDKSLCQVCRDHPRFRCFFNDRVEMGLGFCCEEATRIILSQKEKIELTLVGDDDNQNQLDFNQKNLLDFRNEVLAVIQDRNKDVNRRIDQLLKLCKADVSDKDLSKIVKLFLSFERIDKSWTKRLKTLRKTTLIKDVDQSLSNYCEQFLVNSLYRHLADAEDTMWVRARGIACVISWWVVQSIIKNELATREDFGVVVDVVRAYSAEVEYSQKNLDKLFAFTYKHIKL